jgi:hypothetical protein
MFLRSRARPVGKADNLTAISEQYVRGIINISHPYRPPRPVTGIALLFLFTLHNVSFNVTKDKHH